MQYKRFWSMRSLAVAALVVASVSISHAQEGNGGIQTSISNEFRYGNGEKYEQDKPVGKEYLENLLNSRIYIGDFTVGFRLQIDKPREYGRDTIGLTQYYVEFQRDNLRVRGGSFYNLVDRGLVFNTFESRPLGFDTKTDGIKLDYESPEFTAGLFGGIMDYADIITPSRVENYLVRGGSGEVRPVTGLGIGGAFIQATGRPTRSAFFKEFDAYMRQAYLRGDYEGFTGYLSYADKRTVQDSSNRAVTSSQHFGYGAYAMLGYNNESVGVTAEMKSYRFDLIHPNEQQVGGRETRALPFQNPPTLIPEYDKTLLARNPHATDVSDELGFQVETAIYPFEGLTLNLLASAGSRHNAWTARPNPDSNAVKPTIYERVNASPLAFPELKDVRYSPYWEFYLQGEHELNDDLTLTAGVQHKDNTLYSEGNGAEIEPHSEIYRATTIMLESVMSLSSRDNLHAIVEMQRVFDSKKVTAGSDSLQIKPSDGTFDNLLLTLEYTRSPRWAINTRLEFTTTDQEQGGRKIWPVIGGTYRIGDAHLLGLQYGSERGGVVCTGGVCRLINPFTGFRLSLVSKL